MPGPRPCWPGGPEGVGLIAELGLSGELRRPGTTSAGIWTRGEVRPLPRRQFMGVPADFDELAAAGLLSDGGLARARRAEQPADPADAGDVSVTERVGGRIGQELVDRARRAAAGRGLRRPLRGPVIPGHAGSAGRRRARYPLAQRGRRLPAARPVRPVGPAGPAPGAGVHDAGRRAGQPAPALAGASGAEVRTTATVRELTRLEHGWRLTVGSAHAPQWLEADAVILALPGRPAGRLLGAVPGASAAAAALAEIEYASMAIVTLAYPDGAFPAPAAGSGFLVPAVDGRAIKAVTFSTVKWPHLDQAGLRIVRCSVGRLGDEAVLQRDDADLAGLAAADLAAATGVRGAPADTRVTRWGGGLPQYSVAPGPGGADPGRGGRPARPGGLRRGLRRRRHPGLHRLGRPGGRPGPGPPGPPRARQPLAVSGRAGPRSVAGRPAEVVTLQPAKAATWAVWALTGRGAARAAGQRAEQHRAATVRAIARPAARAAAAG